MAETGSAVEYAGDSNHPDHEEFLLELGRATFAAIGMTGTAFDILRVHCRIESAELYNDDLGNLQKRLEKLQPELTGIEDFLNLLERSRNLRNDLFHSLPVKHGLHRRQRFDLHYIRNFYTVEELREATALFEETRAEGNRVLYADGGDGVARWYDS